MRTVSTLVRYGYVPFMLIGLNAAAYRIVSRGHSFVWLALVLAAAYAASFAAERVAPFFGEWNGHGHDDHANLLHVVIYELGNISGLLLIPVITWLLPFQGLWPTEWPLWAQVLLAYVVADFAFMVMHTLSHRYAILWRLHAVHHGVGRLYGLNGVVRHPLHQGLDMVVGLAPLVVLGMPVNVAILVGVAVSITLIVQHSNVDARLGPLTSWLSIGRNHHLHHVNWGKEGDCNFGMLFTGWDKLLGTFKAAPPRPVTAADMGIDEVPDFPTSYVEQLVFPFIYKPGAGAPGRVPATDEVRGGARRDHSGIARGGLMPGE